MHLVALAIDMHEELNLVQATFTTWTNCFWFDKQEIQTQISAAFVASRTQLVNSFFLFQMCWIGQNWLVKAVQR